MKRYLYILLIGICWSVYYGYNHPLFAVKVQSLFNTNKAVVLTSNTTISLAYQLSRQNWTDFTLPTATNRIKIITNSIVPQQNYDEDITFKYSIAYQLVDGTSKTILQEGVYHFQTNLSFFRYAKEQEYAPASFLEDPTKLPTDGRIMQIDLSKEMATTGRQTGKRRIRFRINEQDATSAGILARVYLREKTTSQKGSNSWQRLHLSKREKLAQGNIYPQDLLENAEKENLLKNQWLPAGPEGIPNRDFNVRRLYTRNGQGVQLVSKTELKTGPITGPMSPYTFAVDEVGSDLQFHFTAQPSETSEQPVKGAVTISWFGRRIDENKSWQIEFDDITQSFSHRFEGGLIEIIADRPTSIHIFDRANEWQEIFPPPRYAKMYTAGTSKELSFKIRHVDSHPTPVKVTVRVPAEFLGQGSHSFIYELIDKDSHTVKQEKLQFSTVTSLYDKQIGSGTELAVSEPVAFYFRLPQEITGFMLYSHQPLLFSVANKPPTLVQETMVPEHYYRSSRDKGRFSSWFGLTPLPGDIEQSDYIPALVSLQHRPPERREEIVLGKYQWQPFRPDGNWQGRYLFSKKRGATAPRTESLGSTYHELKTNTVTPMHLEGPAGMGKIRPNLIYLRNDNSRTELQLYIDGKKYFTKTITGKRGLLALPVLSPGDHSLTVSAPKNSQIFVSNMVAGSNAHSVAFAYTLSKQGFSISYNKENEEELLGFHYYSPCGQLERVRIGVKLTDGRFKQTPTVGATQPQRLYDIRTGNQPELPILYSESACTDSGQQFYFPMGSDLAPGKYTIAIKPENDPGGLIRIYRITTDQDDWKKFFRDNG